MSTVKEAIEVTVPVRTAYNQWTQFEDFPKFMEGVEQVRQLDDRHLQWRAQVGGRTKEWRAEITEQRPDERIAWHSEEGAENAGIVTFDKLDESHCRVTVQLDADPEGPMESAGDAMGMLKRRVKADLERFKAFIERRGSETGEWRGEIGGENPTF